MKDEESNADEIEICQNIEPHEDDTSVKSKAVVKYATYEVPAKFTRLECNTDLNLPPSNWLSSQSNIYQSLYHSPGFASFRMAHMFPDCLGEVDVVSGAENIKTLLKLPYSPKTPISMMVHKIGNTLLIDEFDIQKYLLRRADDDWKWLHTFILENILSSLSEKDRHFCLKDKSRRALQRKNLLSKFLYHSLQKQQQDSSSKDSNNFDYNNISLTTDTVESEIPNANNNSNKPLLLSGPVLPEPNIEENVPDPTNTNHIFNRNVVWTFEDIRMLIGTDMPIFGGGTRPCISLRLRDIEQPINVLTGIDYWLDNLMCNVPEVVMCYHLDGIVQKYELIKTEDLPYLEDSKFSPQVIRNVAQNILAFLKANATKAGHTYWLFKGKNDDVVKLYDLTTLYKNNESATSDHSKSNQSSGNDDNKNNKNKSSNETDFDDNETTTDSKESNTNRKYENPFTVPVAMLLYTVARNMKNTSEKISSKKAGSIKTLLDNCIKLLPKEKFPQIVTSSHYILSDLYIPAGTNPKSPNFDVSDDSDDTQSVYEDDMYFSGGINPSTEYCSYCESPNTEEADKEIKENYFSQSSSSSSSSNMKEVSNCTVAVKNICDTLKEFNNEEQSWKHHIHNHHNRSPSPLVVTVEERCKVSLDHIKDGIDCLQYFSTSETESKNENLNNYLKEQEKQKIIHEEQNPNMAKPFQPIPLPYGKLKPESKVLNHNEDSKSVNLEEKKKEELNKNTKNNKKNKTKKSKEKNKKTEKTGEKLGNENNEKDPEKITQSSLNNNTTNENHKIIAKDNFRQKLGSWNIHLKLLLLEKACLTYATLAEHHYALENYGTSLKCIYMAHKCQQIVAKYISSMISQKCCLFSRAGDCLYKLAKNWENINLYLEQFNERSDADKVILKEILKDNEKGKLTEDIPKPKNNIEYLMIICCDCYEKALNLSTDNETRIEILRRLGNVKNDLGVKYMHWSQEEYTKFMETYKNEKIENENLIIKKKNKKEKDNVEEPLYETLAQKSFDTLLQGILAFEKCKDTINSALLLCNMGRFMRYRAHIHVKGEKPGDLKILKKFYQLAFTYYERALVILGTRKQSSDQWDLVNWELSTAVFTLAKQIQDNSDINDGPSEEIEREIVELLQKSLKLCDVGNSNSKQIIYMYRSGLIHQRLGSFYHNQFRNFKCENGISKPTLQLCRLHYERAAKILEGLKEVKDYLEVQLKRIALQEYLAESQSTNQKIKSLQTALQICFDSKIIFDYMKNHDLNETCQQQPQEFQQQNETMNLIKLFENRLQFILKTLAKLCLVKTNSKEIFKLGDAYKAMFGLTLNVLKISNEQKYAEHLSNILEKIMEINTNEIK